MHTVETNPPEYHQLYDMLSASCLVHNTHQNMGGKGVSLGVEDSYLGERAH